MANLAARLDFLEPDDFDNIASARRIPLGAVGLACRKRTLAALRDEASLRFLPFAAPALATLRKLKIKPR
jgi:hypothetical protein